MDRGNLKSLLSLNQLELTEAEEERILALFDSMKASEKDAAEADTEGLDVMVHVNELKNVLREDVCIKNFTRDDLQESAPEKQDGYWQVPRLVE